MSSTSTVSTSTPTLPTEKPEKPQGIRKTDVAIEVVKEMVQEFDKFQNYEKLFEEVNRCKGDPVLYVCNVLPICLEFCNSVLEQYGYEGYDGYLQALQDIKRYCKKSVTLQDQVQELRNRMMPVYVPPQPLKKKGKEDKKSKRSTRR